MTRVFVTHMHPDHIGMAGWILTRKFDARLWITRLEFMTCRMLAADTGREAPEDARALLQRRRLGRGRRSRTTGPRFGGFGRGLYALPDSFHR